VTEEALARAGRTDGFRFCAEPSCDVAYFHPETGERFLRSDVRVRIGQKEITPPRLVCYCFDHTVEEIEAQVAETGTSRIADDITEKCRQGLDRCEETNPQGSCCLGDVRGVLKESQAKVKAMRSAGIVGAHESETTKEDCCAMNSQAKFQTARRVDAGAVAQAGALISAVIASACCWLPLLLIAVGVSGGALSATFEAWRPVLLPVTFALLGAAFYFTYRVPKAAIPSGGGTAAPGDASCSLPVQGAAEACCPADNAKGLTLKKANKVMLWVVTAFVLAFAFFPNYVGYLLGGGDTLAARHDLDKVVVQIEGMTCEACATNIENSLRRVPGVAGAVVSYDRHEALVGVQKGSEPPRTAILAAIAGAGDYTGRFAGQVVWTLAIEGMTCEACAAGLQAKITNLRGVSGASVDYDQGQALVTADASVNEEELRKAVSDAAFSTSSVSKR